MWDLVKTVLGLVLPPLQKRRRVRLTLHRASFCNTGRECYFFTVTNVSHDREIEVTHVWIDGPTQIPAIQPDRPLPKRLKPDESWETWIDVAKVPPTLQGDVFTLGRARLSTGKIVKSEWNKDVPQSGFVPGGPISPS